MIGALAALAIVFAAGGSQDPTQSATAKSAPAQSAPVKAAAPATKTVDPAVVSGKAKDDPNRLVCHMETEMGSRFRVKKCVTQGEAAMRAFEDRQDLERAQGDTYRR